MKFLIIDDDASLRGLVRRLLVKQWPMAVIDIYDPVKSGMPGRDFPWGNYDVVLLDYDFGMDQLNGLDVLGEIKKDGGGPIVIMVTSQESVSLAVRAMKKGAQDYLLKYDVVTDRLYAIIREAIAKQERERKAAESKRGAALAGKGAKEPAGAHYFDELQIEGYRFIRELARSYTTAVLAERIVDDRAVVIKLQRLKDMNFSALLMERFAQELNILSELHHPNVIEVLDHGVTESCIYYAMEHLSLGDLAQRLKRERATPAEAVEFTRQISSGVGALHSRNVVHRDIKPSNMLFKTENSLVIADLGIAKDLSLKEGLTEQGEVLGTPYYMSPEQFGDGTIDRRSDIYSLGILFYELLTGTPPFMADSLMQVLRKHAHDAPPPLPEHLAIWQPVIDKVLSKRPEDRYQDVDEFLAALEED